MTRSLAARFPPLQSRDFRLLFGGLVVSLTGTHMQRVALAWQVYELTGSPLSLGLLGLFRVTPILVLALGGGVVADAFDRRRLLLATQTVLALESMVLAVTTLTGHVTPGLIYAVSFAAGAATAFDNPARQALTPRLVPAAHLASALSLNATAWQLAAVTGPALGGILIAWGGAAPVYLLDALSYGAVIAALRAIRHRAPSPGIGAVSLKAALEGIAFLRRSPLILSTMVLDFAATFFGGATLLLPVFAAEVLRVGPRTLGLLFAAQPAGALLAATAMSVGPTVRRQGPVLLVSVAVYGLAMAAFGASRWLALSLAALAVAGAADTVSTVIRQTMRQILTPDALRGRMTSVNMVFFIGGPQLGEVEAGVVAKLAGPAVAVVSGGLLAAASALAAAWAVPDLRRYRGVEEGKEGAA